MAGLLFLLEQSVNRPAVLLDIGWDVGLAAADEPFAW
jgi:hypothetical protein